MKTSTDKLNEKLGITSIDELFEKDGIKEILDNANSEIQTLQNQLKDKNEETSKELINTSSQIQNSSGNIEDVEKKVLVLNESLCEITSLIDQSKNILKNVYTFITGNNFIDADIISAAAKMIEANRVVISDYIELYKEKARLMHQIEMEVLRHKNRIEMENIKADLKIKVALATGKKIDADTSESETIEYTQESAVQAIKQAEIAMISANTINI